MEQVSPGIRSPEDGVRDHDARHRPERQAIAGVSGGRVLMLRAVPDVRQAVGRFDDLAGPAMRVPPEAGSRRGAPRAGDSRPRIAVLPGLVVLTAEDDDVKVAMWLDAKVGTGRPYPTRAHRQRRRASDVPRSRNSYSASFLKSGACKSGHADQRIVRRNDDVPTTHRVAIGLHRGRIV